MNKFVLLIITSLTLSISVSASARVACEDLKGEIATKIMNNGVPEDGFRLDIVPNEQADQAVQSGGQIVGSCDGSTSKIIYTRFLNGERNAAAEMASPSQPVTGERLADDAQQVIENPQNAQMVDPAQNAQMAASQNSQTAESTQNVQSVEPTQSAPIVVPPQNAPVVVAPQNAPVVVAPQNAPVIVAPQNAPVTNNGQNSQMTENRQIGQIR